MATSKKILSIIVAAYNRGSMIDDCLKTFCDDRFIDDIEVIVVNDGSTDDTVKRAEKYCKKYPKSIKIIHQENSGAGAAVNNGIKHATGKYLRLVDGDDWVITKNLAKFVENLKTVDVDVAFTNYVSYHDVKKKLLDPVKIIDMPTNQVFNFEDYWYRYNPPIRMHHATFRASIMKKHVKLDNGFYTDSQYVFYPTPYIKTAICYDLDIYVYRVACAGQSISPEKMRANRGRHYEILEHLLQFYKEVSPKLSPNVQHYLALQISGFIINHFDFILLAHEKHMARDVKKLFKMIQKKYPKIFKELKEDRKYRITFGGNAVLVHIFAFYLKQRYKHL